NQGSLRPERHHSERSATLERNKASAQGRGKSSLGRVLLHDRVFRQDEERLAEKDDYMTRHSARIIAQCAERALIVLNDVSIISENYVWHQVLKAGNRPRHLRDDYPIALGIQGTSDTSKVYRSASRLCKETLRLIRDEFGGRAKHRRFQEILADTLEEHGL